MDFNDFKILHSEVIMYCQLIENDLKWIYSNMKEGNPEENFNSLSTNSLGNTISMLKNLDNSDRRPLLTSADYNFLKQMKDKRNYWCHQAYIDFSYINDFTYSNEYKNVCSKLRKDYEKFKALQNVLEQIKLKMYR